MITKATQLDWTTIKHFAPSEWPDGVLKHMDASIIEAINQVRRAVPTTHALIPSPVPRGHVRHEESDSRHATNNGKRLSDATDLFCRWRHLWALWQAATHVPSVGGLGVYTDMTYGGEFRSMPMLHIDCRPDRLLWVAWRDNSDDPLKYTYLSNKPQQFFRLLAERGPHER